MARLVETHDVALTFDQLALIYKALQAAKILAGRPARDELLDDTMAVIDQSLRAYVR